MRHGLLAFAVAAAGTLCACSTGGLRPRAQTRAVWSAPMTLAQCSAPVGPRVVFPQKTPFRRTGPGAVVFSGAPSCRGSSRVLVAPIGASDRPGRPRVPRTASGGTIELATPLADAATTSGQIVLLGAPSHTSDTGGSAMLSEGPADGAFSPPQSLASLTAPLGLATAYLGDVAIVSESENPSLTVQLHMQRWFARDFSATTRLGGRDGARRALAVALDYRTDAIAVWWQQGWLWARERHANGALGRLQRFAKTGPDVQLSVLCSDDGRAIVAWVDPNGTRANLYLDISGPGMRLGRGRLLERLSWRHGAALPQRGSVSLVRLSTESVLMAWTGTRNDSFVVRSAGIDLQGTRTISTVSLPSEDATLQDLATGPRGDALALWESTPVAGPSRDGDRAALMAARGVPSSTGVARFETPQSIAAPGRYGEANVALDPASDRAVASWRDENGAIRWAVRSAGR